MPEKPHPFKTIATSEGPLLIREKKSRFLGWAFPVGTVQEAENRISALRDQYRDATHVCYAYRIGVSQPRERLSDDGEPAHSAGSPIFGQIEAAGLHNVLICVVRYYGGTKLGVGGLIQAYREAARGVIGKAQIVTRTPICLLTLDFDYPLLDGVMRCVSKFQLGIRSQQMGLTCHMEVESSIIQCEQVMESLSAAGLERISKEVTF